MSNFIPTIESDAKVVAAKFVTEYGNLERWIAAHPQIATYSSIGAVVLAFAIGFALGHIL